MTDVQTEAPGQELVDRAVAEGGAYEVLQRRLQEQGAQLRAIADGLNHQRQEAFGSSRMEVTGRVRIRTENNCLARDIVQVGDALLFGYNVFLGLKKETRVADVFPLYRVIQHEEGYEAEPLPLTGSFLDEPGFVNDFNELYAYYKNTRLLQLTIRDGKLLASFQIGDRISDIRVFRWSISQTASMCATSTTAASGTWRCRSPSTSSGSVQRGRWRSMVAIRTSISSIPSSSRPSLAT